MIYIVSPYTSYATGDVNRRLEQHARFEQAAKYVALLYRDGERCWSSIVHGHAIKAVVSNIPAEYPFWQALCRDQIARSDRVHILMLPGWNLSVGVADEMNFAQSIDIPVTHVVPPVACFERAVA